MLVLVDIEWVEGHNAKLLTQVAAIRVDENWNIVDKFGSLVCPPSSKEFVWDYEAFSGYSPEVFYEAGSERECVESFSQWLHEDDVISVWHYRSQTELKRFYKRFFPEGIKQSVTHANNKVESLLLTRGETYRGLYTLAKDYGLELLNPPHCAENEVQMMLRVLVKLGIDQNIFTQKGLPGFPSPETLEVEGDKSTDGLVSVRLFDGTVQLMNEKNIVGCCNYKLHPGKISKSLLLEHDCLGKNCPYLKRNENSTYWLHLAERERAREKEKLRKLRTKAEKHRKEARTAEVTEEFWAYLDQTNYVMDIIRVEEEHPGKFKIFYVSDNPFADGNRYPEFLAKIREAHPFWHVILRHIKDEYGKFVTIDEFYSRKRGW